MKDEIEEAIEALERKVVDITRVMQHSVQTRVAAIELQMKIVELKIRLREADKINS